MTRRLYSLIFLWPFLLLSIPYSPERAPWPPFVSGDAFRAYSDYVFDEEDTSLNPLGVKPYATIFVKTDYLDIFFSKIHPHICCKYILITHNSDLQAPGAFAAVLNDEKLVAWFAQNIENCIHPKLLPIPIGIANRMWEHGKGSLIEKTLSQNLSKQHLLYLNIAIATFPQERQLVYNLLNAAPFVYSSFAKPFEAYLRELGSCIFVASPRGNGLDTHRFWEALYVGSYPIVKTSSLDPLFEGLPVVIIQDWSQISEEFLNQKYEEFKSKVFCLDKIYISYWTKLIDSYKDR